MQNLTITRFLFKIYQFFDHTAVNLILRKHVKTFPQICFSVKSKIIALTWWAHISHLISRLHLLFSQSFMKTYTIYTQASNKFCIQMSIHEFNKLRTFLAVKTIKMQLNKWIKGSANVRFKTSGPSGGWVDVPCAILTLNWLLLPPWSPGQRSQGRGHRQTRQFLSRTIK